MSFLKKLFKNQSTIKIPLVRNGKETGQWVECQKGDSIYNQLIKAYGEPLPKKIEVEPLKPSKDV